MNKYSSFILLVLMSCSSWAKVTVHIGEESYQFEQTPRLSEVLAPVYAKSRWYWPSARLLQLNDPVMASKKASVLAQIDTIADTSQSDIPLLSDLQSLQRQVQSWDIQKFIQRSIDYDRARLVEGYNPTITEGEYRLELTKREDYLKVVGLVERPEKVRYEPQACLADLLGQNGPLTSASLDWVFVVQPNGNIKKVGIAYWNRECPSVMPGSYLFVPFEEELLSSTFSDLNQAVIELLVNKVSAQ